MGTIEGKIKEEGKKGHSYGCQTHELTCLQV
jgi:hypothetical protein